MRILVTGSTGYIGGRLAPRLVEAGHELRVIVRDPLKLRDAPWASDVEVVTGDLTDAAAVAEAVELYADRYRQPRVNPERVAILIDVTKMMASSGLLER